MPGEPAGQVLNSQGADKGGTFPTDKEPVPDTFSAGAETITYRSDTYITRCDIASTTYIVSGIL